MVLAKDQHIEERAGGKTDVNDGDDLIADLLAHGLSRSGSVQSSPNQ